MGNCVTPSRGSIKEYNDQCGPTYGANECNQDDENETGLRIQRSINEYNGKQIVGISGRRGHCVDQLTFNYSDGSVRIIGANGGDAVKEKTLKKGESIVMVKWDRLGSSYLGRGFEFVLSSGRSIKVEGLKATWLKYNVVVYSSVSMYSFLADIIFRYDDSSEYNCPAIMVWQYFCTYDTVDTAAKVSITVYSILYNYLCTNFLPFHCLV